MSHVVRLIINHCNHAKKYNLRCLIATMFGSDCCTPDIAEVWSIFTVANRWNGNSESTQYYKYGNFIGQINMFLLCQNVNKYCLIGTLFGSDCCRPDIAEIWSIFTVANKWIGNFESQQNYKYKCTDSAKSSFLHNLFV